LDSAGVGSLVSLFVSRRSHHRTFALAALSPQSSATVTVADDGSLSVEGMTSAGILTVAKHFPGLGRVTGNTDNVAGVVDSETTPTDPNLGSFRTVIGAKVPIVMVALATYTRIDPSTLAFPSYDGNGMFLSMGNIAASAKIGMLFIDFETPHRLRIHGIATVDRDDPLMTEFVGAELLVRVTVTETFINCPRYVHRYQRVQTSKYAPQAGNPAPPPPQWKRLDVMQDVLPQHERRLAQEMGGTITFEDYAAMVTKNEG